VSYRSKLDISELHRQRDWNSSVADRSDGSEGSELGSKTDWNLDVETDWTDAVSKIGINCARQIRIRRADMPESDVIHR
jgi:hypothetical protein